ncbi:MAG TPA: aminoacyl-tRNA hydrolase [Kiritimatiellia bacterium]|nr:aminoacyl-tRNA hydrolase [Kiritimatiellia bacterium]HMO98855.1 aminoacyl-tRNA hydrolase [Kiritimatiellia bacterium]HMP97276.1 aminoacyl-tRNA hydrolase [Kiritimatiellia bacterium]
MKMVVGLGNPGRGYEATPHNIGFEVVDALARADGVKFRKSWRFPLESAAIRVGGDEVLLVKPHTFMNRSGDAVAPFLRKKGAGPESMLVVVDDVELPLGSLRLRARGSAGTHNGLKSLIERLGTMDFPRLRVGVGPAPPGRDLAAFVLGKFPADRQDDADRAVRRAAEAVVAWVRDGVEKTMNQFNR